MLAFYCFSLVFLCFWYAYAIIGLEINIRLDLISNVCINNPGIIDEESFERGIWEASGRHLGGIWEASGTPAGHGAPGGSESQKSMPLSAKMQEFH